MSSTLWLIVLCGALSIVYGIITTRNTVYNQRGEAVMEYHPVRLTRGRS